jgi:hypothetical protein
MTAAAQWCGVLGVAMLAACGDPPVPDPSAPPPSHVVVRTDPAGATDCPFGGSVVSSGLDRDGDGVLQDAEIANRTRLCNPMPVKPPPGIAVRLVAEPAGLHCQAGGTAVQSGPDLDGDGVLEDGEVSHTDYVCGLGVVTRLRAEPAGASCAAGGVAFLAGLDRNGNRVLDDDEIDSTELECGDLLARDVEIASDADVAALAAVRVITGTLGIRFTSVSSVSLPRLEHVGGSLLVLDNFPLTELALPALRDVDGAMTLSFSAVTTVTFPQLERVGALDLDHVALTDLSGFAGLTTIDHDLQISEMQDLRSIELSNLAIGGNLDISFDDGLTRVALDLADHVGFVTIEDDPQLEALDLSVRPRQRPAAEIGDVEIFADDKLAHVGLGADQVSSLAINFSAAISDVVLDVSRFQSTLSIFDPVPFRLALSSPRGDRIELGESFIISGPLTSLQSTVPIVVDGQCVFDKTQLTAIDERAGLSSVLGGLRLSDNARLTEVAPLALRGSLQVINNASLRSLGFLSLVDPGEIADGIVISGNPVLASATSLEAVAHVGGSVDVESNPLLGSLFGPALTWIAGDLVVDRNDGLAGLRLPGLQHVLALDVSVNQTLGVLELPALLDAHDQLFVFSNPQLRHLALDALQHSDLCSVAGNAMLPACEVLAVFAHVTGFHSQSGNDNAATCVPR